MVSDRILDLFLEVLRLESHTDSLEIGAPSKGGVVKVYGSFADPEDFRKRVDAALELRRHARRGLSEEAVP